MEADPGTGACLSFKIRKFAGEQKAFSLFPGFFYVILNFRKDCESAKHGTIRVIKGKEVPHETDRSTGVEAGPSCFPGKNSGLLQRRAEEK